MGRPRSLEDMIADVRQRTNTETSTFVTDAEIQEYLNQELAELWGHITQGSGSPFYRSATQISVVAGTSLYDLPADFWQLQGVEALIDSQTVAIRPFMAAERARLLNSTNRYPWCSRLQYRIQATKIEFLPATDTFTATVWYTPNCPRLVLADETFDGFNGWEIAAIYGTCATVREKEETDPSFYEGRKAAIYRQIDSLAATRDANEPERVQDVRGDLPDSLPGLWWSQ